MKSGISFYNAGVGKNLLKRFWPLWLAYFLALLVLLPMKLSGMDYTSWVEPLQVNYNVLWFGVKAVWLAVVFGALAAMAMFGYLYGSRSCCMMSSLPVRRETLFSTACLTGIIPMLLADVLTFAITALAFVPGGIIKPSALLQWLAAAAMGSVAFYGMAVFCAMLTGNILVLPAVYVVLNFAVAAAEYAVRSLLGVFLYGYCYDSLVLLPLSPMAEILENFSAANINALSSGGLDGEFVYSGMIWLEIYCAAGLLLMGAALLLYKRRRMETAGDTVAISALKPVFKYCMTFGTAVVFAYAVCEWWLDNIATGSRLALCAGVLMVIGAFIGYFAAEMITKKTLSVFRGSWRGFAVSACIVALFATACELDVTGYETYVPAAEDIVYIEYVYGDIKEPENIEAYTLLQEHIVSGKERNENLTADYTSLAIDCRLRDGSHLGRIYKIDASADAASDPDSDLSLYTSIMNSSEARGYRTAFSIPLSYETLNYCEVNYYDAERSAYSAVRLSAAEAMELYNDCILPDIEDGCLGDYYFYDSDKYDTMFTDVDIYYELRDRTLSEENAGSFDAMNFNIQINSSRCLEWLEENLGIVPLALYEVYATETKGFSAAAE